MNKVVVWHTVVQYENIISKDEIYERTDDISHEKSLIRVLHHVKILVKSSLFGASVFWGQVKAKLAIPILEHMINSLLIRESSFMQ